MSTHQRRIWFAAGAVLALALVLAAPAVSLAQTPPPAPNQTIPNPADSNPTLQNLVNGQTVTPTANPCGDSNFTFYKGTCIPNSQYDKGSIAGASSLTELVLTVTNYLLILAGMIAVVAVIIGGYWYITAAGNAEQSEKGRKVLIDAVIGVVVIVLSYAIVNIIIRTLTTTDITKTS
ncbi:MAG: hypothetical protein KGJ93_02585 [Patescibacteria group bacterium]|nr:hypothetical protein [Patescibacteria group bacterium]